MSTDTLSKNPTPDTAEFNAFFPSPFSLDAFTSRISDLSDADYPNPYSGPKKVLLIAADERYMPTDTGKLFSTGNHPVETLLPMYHMHQAGFDFDIATVSGNSAKLEFWGMPVDDKAITDLHVKFLARFRNPLKLSDVLEELGPDSDYAAVFIPGGHAALMGLPTSEALAAVFDWAFANDRFIISICHGPAAFLAPVASGRHIASPFAGYSIVAFPDAVDRQTPEIGYMPGGLTWFFGERLKAQGVTLINSDISGAVNRDRKVLTGDSPAASNALGQMAAKALLEEVNRA